MQSSATHDMQNHDRALLRFLRAAHSHVGQTLRHTGNDPVATARAAVSYDLAMLALGHHARLSLHAGATTAAQLLFLAAELSRRGGGPAQEPAHCAAIFDRAGLERDATVIGDQNRILDQADLAAMLGRFCDALHAQGLDPVHALAQELAEAQARTRHYAAEAIVPTLMLPRDRAATPPGLRS